MWWGYFGELLTGLRIKWLFQAQVEVILSLSSLGKMLLFSQYPSRVEKEMQMREVIEESETQEPKLVSGHRGLSEYVLLVFTWFCSYYNLPADKENDLSCITNSGSKTPHGYFL